MYLDPVKRPPKAQIKKENSGANKITTLNIKGPLIINSKSVIAKPLKNKNSAFIKYA